MARLRLQRIAPNQPIRHGGPWRAGTAGAGGGVSSVSSTLFSTSNVGNETFDRDAKYSLTKAGELVRSSEPAFKATQEPPRQTFAGHQPMNIETFVDNRYRAPRPPPVTHGDGQHFQVSRQNKVRAGKERIRQPGCDHRCHAPHKPGILRTPKVYGHYTVQRNDIAVTAPEAGNSEFGPAQLKHANTSCDCRVVQIVGEIGNAHGTIPASVRR